MRIAAEERGKSMVVHASYIGRIFLVEARGNSRTLPIIQESRDERR